MAVLEELQVVTEIKVVAVIMLAAMAALAGFMVAAVLEVCTIPQTEALVVVALFALSGRAILVVFHQLIQVICNETFYSH